MWYTWHTYVGIFFLRERLNYFLSILPDLIIIKSGKKTENNLNARAKKKYPHMYTTYLAFVILMHPSLFFKLPFVIFNVSQS